MNLSNAAAVLATAILLEGMPELADHAFTIFRHSLSQETVLDRVEWVSSRPVRPRGGYGTIGTAPTPVEEFAWQAGEASPGRYGVYSAALKHDV